MKRVYWACLLACALLLRSAGASAWAPVFRGAIVPTSVDDRVGASLGVACSEDGTLYSISGDRRILAYSPDGIYLGEYRIPREIENPQGLAILCDRGDGGERFVVASTGGTVFLLGSDARMEMRIDADPPLSSGMVAVRGNKIYCFDFAMGAVRIFTLRGEEIGRVGKGRILRAVGLAVGEDGGIAVADQGAYKVRVFREARGNEVGEILLEFGRAGGVEGSFSILTGIAVDAGGRFWVMDSTKQVVHVFDSTGAFLQVVPVPAPCAITARGGRVFVASASMPGVVVLGS